MSEEQKPENTPAFPCPAGHLECYHPCGMSLRDYFAAHACVKSQSYFPSSLWQWVRYLCGKDYRGNWTNPEHAAQNAHRVADAMLKERMK